MAGTVCTANATELEPTTYNNQDTGICLDAVPGTLRPYGGGINQPGPICFHSLPILLTVDLGGILIPLEEVQIGATYVGNPAASMSDGLLRGFLAESEADLIILPADIAVVGGDPLSSVLPGGSGCCASHDDRDNHNGQTGWWFYFDFPADEVTYIGP
jgi:hypothetical protein